MLRSNQRGRGQEPVTVQGKTVPAVIVNMELVNAGFAFVQGQAQIRGRLTQVSWPEP